MPKHEDSLRAGQPFNPYRMSKGLFIPEGLSRCDRISPGAKLAWGRLKRYAGENGDCRPSMATLGKEIGVGRRQAQKYVLELERAKLIRRVGGIVTRAFLLVETVPGEPVRNVLACVLFLGEWTGI
jgi:hypothetical protein